MNDLEKAKVRNTDFEAASLRDGFWFIFSDGDDEIAVHASTWSGKEKTYFNDELVLNKWRFGTYSKHSFMIKNQQYAVQLETADPFITYLECKVWKGHACIGKETRAIKLASPWLTNTVWLGCIFLIGFVATSGVFGGK